MSSTVDGRAARCPYFMVFDEKGELAEVLENPSRNVSGSAGPSCAEYLADHGITLLVAEQVGGKMIAALNGHEIRYILFSGSVKDAVARALKEDQ
jgi:predicted Fe-Mo cluster-binding NifX family protein